MNELPNGPAILDTIVNCAWKAEFPAVSLVRESYRSAKNKLSEISQQRSMRVAFRPRGQERWQAVQVGRVLAKLTMSARLR
jgi:hypothetical protein